MRLLSALSAVLCAGAVHAAPDLVLRGTLTGADHQSYRTIPFAVPGGVQRLTLEFDYGGRDQRSVIDLGLLGPDGSLRGWSGGNKRRVTISAVDATPSYLPTAPLAGTWQLLLGVPNLRAGARADYTATLHFARTPDPDEAPLRTGPGWYRGDLHTHTAHSDGSCATRSGAGGVPCPAFRIADAAAARGLDFVAVTDHNGVAHAHTLRELQPYFDTLLLLPGRELTTFTGHANVFGTLAPLDFRVGSAEVPDWTHLLRAARAAGGLVAINHPVRPSGEACMGCAWQPLAADLDLVEAVEAVNGGDADTALSGIAFWQGLLAPGRRVTAIGGSDSHRPGSVGTPTTVVHAHALSQAALLAGIRAGHVFVDVAGSGKRMLEFSVSAGGTRAAMGDLLAAPAGAPLRLALRATHAAGGYAELVEDGRPGARLPLDGDDVALALERTGDGKPHWLRADVRDAQGRLLLLGNPVYLNWDITPGRPRSIGKRYEIVSDE